MFVPKLTTFKLSTFKLFAIPKKYLYLHPYSDQPLAKIVHVALNQTFKTNNHV